MADTAKVKPFAGNEKAINSNNLLFYGVAIFDYLNTILIYGSYIFPVLLPFIPLMYGVTTTCAATYMGCSWRHWLLDKIKGREKNARKSGNKFQAGLYTLSFALMSSAFVCKVIIPTLAGGLAPYLFGVYLGLLCLSNIFLSVYHFGKAAGLKGNKKDEELTEDEKEQIHRNKIKGIFFGIAAAIALVVTAGAFCAVILGHLNWAVLGMVGGFLGSVVMSYGFGGTLLERFKRNKVKPIPVDRQPLLVAEVARVSAPANLNGSTHQNINGLEVTPGEPTPGEPPSMPTTGETLVDEVTAANSLSSASASSSSSDSEATPSSDDDKNADQPPAPPPLPFSPISRKPTRSALRGRSPVQPVKTRSEPVPATPPDNPASSTVSAQPVKSVSEVCTRRERRVKFSMAQAAGSNIISSDTSTPSSSSKSSQTPGDSPSNTPREGWKIDREALAALSKWAPRTPVVPPNTPNIVRSRGRSNSLS